MKSGWSWVLFVGWLCMGVLHVEGAPKGDSVEADIAEALDAEPVDDLTHMAEGVSDEFGAAAARNYVSPATALAMARKGNIAEAEAIIRECLRQAGTNSSRRAEALFEAYRMYDPLVGLPEAADRGKQQANRDKALDWLKQAAAVREATKLVRWKILTTLFEATAVADAPVKQALAAGALADLDALPGLTDGEKLVVGTMGMTLGQVAADYPRHAEALERVIPLTNNLTERIRLQLRLGDVCSAFLKDKAKATAQWKTVAGNEQAHPYYRAVAMEKLAHAAYYREPYPNHLLASFPERKPVAKERTVPEGFDEALGWWRKLLSLNLANWVKLDALAGMARACESGGRPTEGLVLLEREALSLPGLTPRQTAEVKFIMAQLANAAGDPGRAAALCRETVGVALARPQLLEAARKLLADLESSGT